MYEIFMLTLLLAIGFSHLLPEAKHEGLQNKSGVSESLMETLMFCLLRRVIMVVVLIV